MKRRVTFKEGLIDMITSNAGSISSKIVIGAVTYLILTAGMTVMIITSASLLGLTTVENIKQKKNDKTKN